MLRISPSKINLGLHITDKRADGYHNIQSVFYPVDWSDIVEVAPAAHTALHISGSDPCADGSQNICLRAYAMLQADYSMGGADIYLHKRIPVGAGLGGGSSNAAAVLLATNDAFNLQLSTPQLERYAAMLGSDCPFFIYNQPMLAQGRGEVLSPLNVSLRGYELLVVKPPVSVSTAAAYSDIKINSSPTKMSSLATIVSQPVPSWKATLHNDFEPSVFAKYPILSQIKAELYAAGAEYAAMTGSGSAIYGIFAQIPNGLCAQMAQHGAVWHEVPMF